MIAVRETGIRPGEVNQSARHVLFVEGKDNDGTDATFLGTYLGNLIRVQAMGPCFHVESAAEALHPEHPDYYFLIDRDHRSQEAVDRSWSGFPDPDRNNLLIWRMREIENHFLDPGYLVATRSDDCNWPSEEDLRSRTLDLCRKRLILDCVAETILRLREDQKANWIKTPTSPVDFPDYASGLEYLKKLPDFAQRMTDLKQQLDPDNVTQLYKRIHSEHTGGKDPLNWESGQWRARIKARPVFSQIVNNCCNFNDRQGKVFTGPELRKQVLKSLALLPDDRQPEDFRSLKSMISRTVGLRNPDANR